jgi:hypothetical protein
MKNRETVPGMCELRYLRAGGMGDTCTPMSKAEKEKIGNLSWRLRSCKPWVALAFWNPCTFIADSALNPKRISKVISNLTM